MSSKKPWRTVVTGDSTGRFTREQIRDAVDSVASKSKPGSAESKSGTVPRREGRVSESATTARAATKKGGSTSVSRANKAASTATTKTSAAEKGKTAASSKSVKGASKGGGAATAKKADAGKARNSRKAA